MHSAADYAPFSIMTDFIIHNLHYKRGWGGRALILTTTLCVYLLIDLLNLFI